MTSDKITGICYNSQLATDFVYDWGQIKIFCLKQGLSECLLEQQYPVGLRTEYNAVVCKYQIRVVLQHLSNF